MAAEAVLRDLVLHVAGAMAVGAGDTIVHAFEREPGLLLVIELGGLPVLGHVAFAALQATLAVMDIVRLVAGDAVLRCVFVAVAEMAGGAGRLGVLVAQREGGLVVVVTHVPPGGGVVARATVASELAFVRLFLLVALDALARRLAVRLAGDVTALARRAGVGALERI